MASPFSPTSPPRQWYGERGRKRGGESNGNETTVVVEGMGADGPMGILPISPATTTASVYSQEPTTGGGGASVLYASPSRRGRPSPRKTTAHRLTRRTTSYDVSIVSSHVSTLLCCNLLGLGLGYATQSYAVYNACSIPLCWVLLALPPLAHPKTLRRVQISAAALLLYAARHVLDTILLAAAAASTQVGQKNAWDENDDDFVDDGLLLLQEPTTTPRVTLQWVSLRMLILYATVSVVWSLLSLLPHVIGSSLATPGNSTCTRLGLVLIALGLMSQALPDRWVSQMVVVAAADANAQHWQEWIECFRLQVIGGEFLFWLGVTILNAPALVLPPPSRPGRYGVPPAAPSHRGFQKTGVLVMLLALAFGACALWAVVVAVPVEAPTNAPLSVKTENVTRENMTTTTTDLLPVEAENSEEEERQGNKRAGAFSSSKAEWRMIRTLLLTRHGFLKNNNALQTEPPTPPPLAVRGHLDSHHHMRLHTLQEVHERNQRRKKLNAQDSPFHFFQQAKHVLEQKEQVRRSGTAAAASSSSSSTKRTDGGSLSHTLDFLFGNATNTPPSAATNTDDTKTRSSSSRRSPRKKEAPSTATTTTRGIVWKSSKNENNNKQEDEKQKKKSKSRRREDPKKSSDSSRQSRSPKTPIVRDLDEVYDYSIF